MKYIKLFLRNILTWLTAGATTFIIAACYGMPGAVKMIDRWIVKVKNSTNEPIKGLQVTFLIKGNNPGAADTLSWEVTDSSGSATVYYENLENGTPMAHIHDIDDSANGGLFADTSIIKGIPDSSVVVLK